MATTALRRESDVIAEAEKRPVPGWEDLTNSLPTLKELANGRRSYWSVPKASMRLQEDLNLGGRLAEQTLSILKRHQISNGILAKILEQAPSNCLIAKGFRLKVEQELLS